MEEIINKTDAVNYLKEMFARAGKKNDKRYYSKDEERNLEYDLAVSGAKRFKRKTLGLLGYARIESIDYFAERLYELKMVPSVEAGKQEIPKIAEAFNVRDDGFQISYFLGDKMTSSGG